ncbi:hypothetical protein [Embleya sp. NPDC005971]|uniref:hypothetical protein n=1 Tax=Embleya sp. NPDC005971 TaxID=3156724 RepID=UPI0033C67317
MSRLVKLAAELEKADFTSDTDIVKYRNTLRALGAEIYMIVSMDAEVLQATLGQYKGQWYQFGAGTRLRAKMVASHLKVAAEAAKLIGISGAKMHASFQRHYVKPELEAKAAKSRKPTGKKGFTIGGKGA